MADEHVRIVPTQNERSAPIFAVLVKRSYRLRNGITPQRIAEGQPFLEVDRYWDDGDPTWATVKRENELAPYKLATDVVVIGKAYAPQGQPVEQMDASVEIGRFRKTIRVIGDRRCAYCPNQPPLFSEPQPFSEMEIRYERAYGGKDLVSLNPIEFHYPRNPMGRGLAVKNLKEVVEGLALPNLEDPNDLLTPDRLILGDAENWNRQPLPQGFGWLQKTSYPRCSFVGAIPGFVDVDEVMREEGLNWVPKRQIALSRQFRLPSFDVRFNNGGSWGLIVPFLQGNEPVALSGLNPDGPVKFELPGEELRLSLDLGEGAQELKPVLQTVCIRLEEQELDMIWRGALEYPGIDWLPEMKRLHVEVH